MYQPALILWEPYGSNATSAFLEIAKFSPPSRAIKNDPKQKDTKAVEQSENRTT